MKDQKRLSSQQQAENAVKWLNALKSGRYKKTVGILGDDTGYCCLGVGCKVMKLENVDYSFGTDDRLVQLIGLRSDSGGFDRKITIGERDTYNLTGVNDDIFPKDKNFKNVHQFIVDNIRRVFRPAVAKVLLEMGIGKTSDKK